VFLALPKESNGRVWRQAEVPAFPPQPSPTHPTRCCQHTLVHKRKVTRFCMARHLWTSLYAGDTKRTRVKKPLQISKKCINKICRSFNLQYFLARHILISLTVFEIQGFKKSQKIPPPLILGKYCPTVLSRRDSIPS